MKSNQVVQYPVIGISATVLTIDSGSFLGSQRVSVVREYIRAIELAGGIPYILPVTDDKDWIDRQMQMVDGLLLSGGYDVCPLKYDEEPKPGLEVICSERDEYEMRLIQNAYNAKKPIFGICRGLQILNVFFGGTLYQDIHTVFPTANQHNSKAPPSDGTHTLSLVPNKLLHQIFKEESIVTNSFHHQAIQRLAKNLEVNAQAKDGIIEGIEGIEDFFILGVQWHPEMMVNKHPKMIKLFEAFIEACKLRRSS